jgi:hypothetical protein
MTKKALFIHCLATPADFMEGRPVEEVVATVKRWHLERGWSDIGYAKIGHRDGTSADGRDKDNDGDVYEETGAHAKGYNVSGIGIALVGGKGSKRTDKFSDHYTEAQRQWLWDEIDAVRARYGDDIEIRGHNEVSSKACPGFNVQEFLAEGRPRKSTKSTTLAATGSAAAIVGAVAADLPSWAYVAIVAALVGAFIIWKVRK